jgi:glycosyltransferase involved in cell wall biosynthesis
MKPTLRGAVGRDVCGSNARTKAILFSDHCPSRSQGGEELVLREVLLGLAARGWHCLLAYHEWGDLVPQYEKAGIVCRQLDLNPVRPSHPWRFAASVAKQVLWARREGVRLLHCNSYFRAAQAGAVKSVGGFPAVCQFHLPAPEYLSRQYRWGLRQLEEFVAVSDCTAAEWSTALRVPRGRIAVLHNPIDTNRFRPDDRARGSVRRELGIPDHCLVLGYCGRLVREKGIDVLLRAMARLVADHRAIRLLVIGSDAQNITLHGKRLEPELKAIALQLGIADRIDFLGLRADVERCYNAMDILVVPSICSEAFGLTVAEALACGRPVVASRVGGIPEILTGPLEELLVPPNDDEALAAVLRRLIGDPQERARIGQLGRKIVQERFGLVRYLDQFEDLLQGMIR